MIIGLSMGGLVARYALKDMENNAIEHETRLFVSHDTPHHGANIPVGVQAAVQHLSSFKIIDGFLSYTDLFPDIAKALNSFNSPAAKQMVIQRYVLNPINYQLVADNVAYNNFYAELNALGWPTQSKNIILSNGSANGTKIFPDNSQIFGVSGARSLSYFGQLWKSLAISIGTPLYPAVVNGGNINPASMLIQFPLSLFSTKTSLGLDFRINAVPASGTAELYRGDIFVKRKLLWLINSTSYFIKTRINSTSDMKPLDNAPGGTYDLASFGLDKKTFNMPDFFEDVNISIVQPKFCFVPTVSSLGVANPWQNLNANLAPSLACITSGINNYYVQNQNQLHTSYTQPSADWLLQWQSASFDCQKICADNYSIAGPDKICNGTTFSVPNLPTGATVLWSVSGNLTNQTLNGNDITITQKALAEGGTVNLSATIQTACSTWPLSTKSIIVGVPSAVSVSISPNPTQVGMVKQLHAYEYYDFSAQSISGCSYSWAFKGSTSIHISDPTSSSISVVDYNIGATYTAELTISDGCSSRVVYRQAFKIVSQPSGFDYYPNPASNALTITQNNTAGQKSVAVKIAGAKTATKPYSIKLLDKNARVLREASSQNGGDININTSSLPNDTYFLHIFQGKDVVKKQVVVQH